MLESVQSEFAKKFASHTRTSWITEAVEEIESDADGLPVSVKELAEETGNSLDDIEVQDSPMPGVHVVSFGREEYLVADDDDIADKLALENMEDLGVESFSPDFVKHYVEVSPTDAHLIAIEDIDARYEGEMDRDEDAESDEIEEVAARIEKDPIGYFCDEMDIYSEEDLLKQSWIRIDTDRLFKDAMDQDGRGHFISMYDGEEIELPSGGFAYRNS